MIYSGMLGYSEQQEVRPGIWEEVITEKPFRGRIEQRTETVENADQVLPQYRTTTTVSGLARGHGLMENANLRYLTIAGKRYMVVSNTSAYPRLTMTVGGEYHGPGPDRR